MSVVKTIRIDADTEQLIKSYLEVSGESMSSFATTAMREKIEDELDAKDLVAAIKRNENKPTVSHEDMMAKYGL
jgi:uncharacterized protein (DUF1778 family)